MNNKLQEIKSQDDIKHQDTRSSDVLIKALEKCEKLETQLYEANNVIIKADWYCDFALQSLCGFSKYLMKYNIKRNKELDK
jgi:hypothetical protein